MLVEVSAGGVQGLGFTYGDPATGRLIQDTLAPLLQGRDAMAIPAAWQIMIQEVRRRSAGTPRMLHLHAACALPRSGTSSTSTTMRGSRGCGSMVW